MWLSLTFVFAVSRLRLNTHPSVLCLSCVSSSCCEASRSMAANIMLERVGTRTQPCFTPFVTVNESDVSPLSRIEAIMLSCN